MSLDLAVVVGHSRDPDNPAAQGARDLHGVSERDWCDDLAGWVGAQAPGYDLTARVFYRTDVGHYEAKMRQLCAEINAASPRLVLSLHFNGGGGGAGVVGVHYPGSTRGALAARELAAAVRQAQGSARAKIRDFAGLDGLPHSWQPTVYEDGKKVGPIPDYSRRMYPGGEELYILSLTRAPAVIIETHSGIDALDLDLATAARDEGATARAICETVADLMAEWA